MRIFDQAYLRREFGQVIGCSAVGDYYAMSEGAVDQSLQAGWTDEKFEEFLRERCREYAKVALSIRGVLGRMTQKRRAALRNRGTQS